MENSGSAIEIKSFFRLLPPRNKPLPEGKGPERRRAGTDPRPAEHFACVMGPSTGLAYQKQGDGAAPPIDAWSAWLDIFDQGHSGRHFQCAPNGWIELEPAGK